MSGSTDQAFATLPADAFAPGFFMDRLADRDQVANMMGRDGWEAFERPLPHYLFRTALAAPGLIIDIGANTGFYSLLAACASAGNRVLACEPVPAILDILERNIRENQLQDRIRVVQFAIGDRNGSADLYIPSQEHGLIETSASLRYDFKQDHSGRVPVSVRTLDRVLFRPSLMFRRVTLIKIDVEGHEAAVIAGAYRTIRRHRPIVFIEILPSADFDALNRFIRQNRYADVRLLPDSSPVVGQQVTFDPVSWNHALVPQEQVGGFIEAAPGYRSSP